METTVITGGSRGIGAAAVARFAQRGDRVVFLYEKDHEAARKVAQATGAEAICCDVADGEAVRRAFASIGHLDNLILCAGICRYGLLQDLSEEDWDRIFAVNVKGIYTCVKAAMPAFLQAQKGSIVTVSSMWGQVGASCEAAYSATKGASPLPSTASGKVISALVKAPKILSGVSAISPAAASSFSSAGERMWAFRRRASVRYRR